MVRSLLPLLSVFAFSTLVFSHDVARQELGAAAFSLLPAAQCSEAADRRQCQVAGPKDWSQDERQMLRETMGRLLANDPVRGILVAAQENGFNGLRRYATDTRFDSAAGWVSKFGPAFVLYGAKIIGLTDGYFQTASMKDPIAGYRFGDFVVVHELIHAFDNRQESTNPGFTLATGWNFKNNRWIYTRPVDIADYNGVYAQTLTLYGRGNHVDAWSADRSFATTMTFPLPTIQSLATPAESFADILAHLILDPRATSYLKPDVVAWFDKHVMPQLAEKAARFKAADYDIP